jgi:anaerobic magnesium-protoporphyrin IX monomethyl ester cyclase
MRALYHSPIRAMEGRMSQFTAISVGAEPSKNAEAKVLLVRAHYQKLNRAPGFPVGIALIASYLESKEVPVQILDLAIQKDWKEALRRHLESHSYAIVGVSLQIVQYDEALQAARFVRQNSPSIKIVFGGSFPSSAPEECIRNPEVDIVCCAEGEITLFQVFKALESGCALDEVEGIVFKKEDGQVVRTPPRALIEDLDRMPLPAYHLFDIESYICAEHTSDFTGKKQRSMELSTSRGCPYQCIFCHSFFGKKFRGRSAQHVFDEILMLHAKYRISEFVVWDDTFTMDVQRAKDICDLIIKSGIKIALQLRGGVRVEQMDEELMSKLKAAGAEIMCVGIESAVWRVQKMIKKNLRIEKVEAFLKLAKKYRLTTIGLLMMGFPGESLEEIKENMRWAKNSELDYTFFSIVTPFPGTELYQLAVREGYLSQNPDFKYMSVRIPNMDTEVKAGRIKWLQIQGYLKFYLKPRRLRKLLSSGYAARTFAGSLLDYVSVACSYYSRRLSSQTRT